MAIKLDQAMEMLANLNKPTLSVAAEVPAPD